MNTANKLTLLRIILVPAFLVCLLVPFPFHGLAALIIFALASITDTLDGHIARKYNMITDFGKFLDPLADKVLVLSALIAFVELDIFGAWIPIIILARELMVSGIRLVAVSNSGKVIAASIWGKLKTVTQMVAICVILAALSLIDFRVAPAVSGFIMNTGVVLMIISVVMTIISGIDYLKGNISFINHTK